MGIGTRLGVCCCGMLVMPGGTITGTDGLGAAGLGSGALGAAGLGVVGICVPPVGGVEVLGWAGRFGCWLELGFVWFSGAGPGVVFDCTSNTPGVILRLREPIVKVGRALAKIWLSLCFCTRIVGRDESGGAVDATAGV